MATTWEPPPIKKTKKTDMNKPNPGQSDKARIRDLTGKLRQAQEGITYFKALASMTKITNGSLQRQVENQVNVIKDYRDRILAYRREARPRASGG